MTNSKTREVNRQWSRQDSNTWANKSTIQRTRLLGRAAKRGTDAATELLYDTKRHLQRHPIEAAAVTFAVGIAAGAVIGWLLRRNQLSREDAIMNEDLPR
jgi:ferric-dicitrate binding protein FerR (iron transport regulator)